MTTSIDLLYGTSARPITITLNSLANGSARGATAIANTGAVPFEDLAVNVTVVSASAGVSSTGTVNVYAAASVDGGSTYPDGATGTDGAVTLTVPPNSKLIGTINVVANSTTYHSEAFSVAAVFGGYLPQYVAIIVQNSTGAALAASGNSAQYQGVQHQIS